VKKLKNLIKRSLSIVRPLLTNSSSPKEGSGRVFWGGKVNPMRDVGNSIPQRHQQKERVLGENPGKLAKLDSGGSRAGGEMVGRVSKEGTLFGVRESLRMRPQGGERRAWK